LEQQVDEAAKKAFVFQMITDIAKKEYKMTYEKTPQPNN
jgi:hypothetical protein